jgi:hypothetical protein
MISYFVKKGRETYYNAAFFFSISDGERVVPWVHNEVITEVPLNNFRETD